MREPSEQPTEPEPSSDEPPVRRFDARLAAIYATGALVIVLAAALTATVLTQRERRASPGDALPTLHLGAGSTAFTATTLPDAGLLTMGGAVTALPAVAQGRPTIVNFFSSSCTACRSEMPALERLHRQAGDRVQLVGVDLGDSRGVTASFVAKTKVTYEVLRDPTSLLVDRLSLTAQPMTLWVDARGRIVGHRYGAMTAGEMRDQLRAHLGVSLPPP